MQNPGLPPSWTGERIHRAAHTSAAVIGDIHGRADLLLPLLERIDRPIFVLGDVCDRGPATRLCVEALVERGATGVFGNHDLWFAKWAAGLGFEAYALSIRMGGVATLGSYDATPEQWEKVPRSHAAWVNALHLVIDLEVAGQRYWLVHAGIPSDRPLAGCTLEEVVPQLAEHFENDLLWRKNDPESMLTVDRPIIMGHFPVAQPIDTGDVIAVDTGAGAVYDRLTALLLPEREFISLG